MDIAMSDQSSPVRPQAEDNEHHALSKIAAKDAKKFREEYDLAKGKLVDQKFDPGESYALGAKHSRRRLTL